MGIPMWASLVGKFVLTYAAPLTALAAVLSALAAAVALMLNARATRSQTNSQILIEYTRRYMELVSKCPAEWYRRFEEAPPPSSLDLKRALHLYLDLECQELYLWRSGYFSDNIWNIWNREFIRTLQSPFFKREWPGLRSEFDYHPDFLQYVEKHAQLTPPDRTRGLCWFRNGSESDALPGTRRGRGPRTRRSKITRRKRSP